jgi:hypothetical protein
VQCFFIVDIKMHYNKYTPFKMALFFESYIIKCITLTTRCRHLVWWPGPDQKIWNIWDAVWSSRDHWIYWIRWFTSLTRKGSGWCCMTIIYTNNNSSGTTSGSAAMRPAVGLWPEKPWSWQLKRCVSVDVKWLAITERVGESSRIGNLVELKDSLWM